MTTDRLPERVVGTAVGVVILIACGVLTVRAATVQELMLNPHKLKGCTQINGEHPVTTEASTHYAMAEDVPTSGAPVWHKRYQSFDCEGAMSTIYYYQYPTRRDMQQALAPIEAMIWAGDKPSDEHPELIFAVENVLIVVSSEDPKYFKKQIAKSAGKSR